MNTKDMPDAAAVLARRVSQDAEPGFDPYNTSDRLRQISERDVLFADWANRSEDDISDTIRTHISTVRQSA